MSRMLDMSGRPRVDEIDGSADPDFQDDRLEGADSQEVDEVTFDDEDLDTALAEAGAGDDEE